MPQFDPVLDLSTLDGTNGFRLDGIDVSDRSGVSVGSAGDVNGDGFADIIVGAQYADPAGNLGAGETYVVFGKAGGFTAALDLASLDGSNGFRLEGIDPNDQSGNAVASAGDLNGDGFGDFVIGASLANNGGGIGAGETYVVFGKASGFSAVFDLATLDGVKGFRLEGLGTNHRSGTSVASAGDVNGDGFGDLIVSSLGVDRYAGESYVVFGKAGAFDAAFDLASLDGTNGFRLDGISAYDFSGRSVSSAGDVNGDDFSDVVIGAPGRDGLTGESYVVFGKADGFGAALDLATLDGNNGFRVEGKDAADLSGFSVAGAGDINGDGLADIVVGAQSANPGGNLVAGETYVVFGKTSGFPATIDLATLDAATGFRIDGIEDFDRSGRSVASAGDVNGDGFGDLVIGAFGAASGSGRFDGESYVVFGKATGFGSAISLADLDGNSGFRIEGSSPGGQLGYSVASAGDVNGDGFGDLILGASSADAGGDFDAGESYVIFGHRALSAVTITGTDQGLVHNGGFGDDTINAFGGDDTVRGFEGDDLISGGQGNDTLDGGTGDDTIAGGGGDDVIIGGEGNDTINAGAGKDTIDFRQLGGSVKIDLGAGTYRLSPSLGTGVITGVEQVIGTNGADTITGNVNNNIIQAAKGDDAVDGAGGNDFIAGNFGSDLLTGGIGHDTFDYNALSDSTSALQDVITDFKVSGSDKIDLSTIDADATLGGNQAFGFLATLGAAFTGAGQVRFTQSGGNTFVDVNTDANLATIEMQIQLTGLKTLVATDFIL